jgi:hypothetical protein
MKKIFLIVIVLGLSCVPVIAQSEVGQGELSWTYSYLNREVEIVTPLIPGPPVWTRTSVPTGFGVNFAWNLSNYVAIVTDFSYHWDGFTTSLSPNEVKTGDFIFLGGPRFYARSKYVTGFGHALVGGTRSRREFVDRFTGGDLRSLKVTNTSFTLGLGGGVDVNMSEGVAFRAFQFDYLPTFSNGSWKDNYRVSSGVVFRFGDP